jgi:FkbM family methyltransferase
VSKRQQPVAAELIGCGSSEMSREYLPRENALMDSMTSIAIVAGRHCRVKQTRHGMMIYNIHDAFIGRSLDLYGEFSFDEVRLFAQLVKPGMTVVDVGANIGAHTLYLAQAVSADGTVWAFEPQRLVFQMLCANLALNEIGNVHALQVGVGSEPGRAHIPAVDFATSGNFGGIALQASGQDEVQIATIDSVKLSACHFIKIDVEGMEGDVIAGARETIGRFRPLLYVENDRRQNSALLIAQLWDLDYRLYWHTPPLFNPDNFYGNPHNAFPGILSLNMLCLPRQTSFTLSGFKEITDPTDWPFAD